MTEIEKFYNSFKNEISSLQLAEENGESQEQSFTRICLDMLTQAYYRVCVGHNSQKLAEVANYHSDSVNSNELVDIVEGLIWESD